MDVKFLFNGKYRNKLILVAILVKFQIVTGYSILVQFQR